MTLRQQKLVLYFLDMLESYLRYKDALPVFDKAKKFHSKKELIKMLLWLFPDRYTGEELETFQEKQLYEALVCDYNILLYLIDVWKTKLSAVVRFSQQEVDEFFYYVKSEPHYLRDKPVEQWDGYDRSNYLALLAKSGVTRQVFALFTSEVKEEDKYIVTSAPTVFYDTRQEAEDEVDRCITEENYTKGDLVVYALWKIK